MSKEDEQKKYKGQKYKIIKEKSYDMDSFSSFYGYCLYDSDRKEFFKMPVQTFGAKCEELIAKPILATEFRIYKPEFFIEKAWNRLYFEMRKIYKKQYKKSFNLLDLLKEENLEPLSRWFYIKEALSHKYHRQYRHRIINEILTCKDLINFAGRNYEIWTRANKIKLYHLLIMDPIYGKRIEKLEENILLEIYKNAILKRFPNLPRKDLNLLRKCISFSYREDFFCVPKLNSHFKKPFYFVEIKTERTKTTSPSFSYNQREFIYKFKNKVGLLILWIFLNRHRIEAKWLVPK